MNNSIQRRLQAPFWATIVVCGVGFVVGGAAAGQPGLVVAGVIILLTLLLPLWAHRRGDRAPAWLASATTPRPLGPGQRTRLRKVVPGSILMVAASVFVIVAGSARHQPGDVVIGAIGVVFFGFCLIAAVLMLRATSRPPEP